jgi:putative nucleotidyltransferase with HDIG domain
MSLSRNEALALVRQYVKNENLVKHMLAVESAMAAYAQKYHQDEELWRVIGLLHDFDWEIHPSVPDHPLKGADILRQQGIDESIICTVISHANLPEYPRTELIQKALFACDEITGLITTVALVRPSKSILDVEVSSIKKKFKEKSFAAGVNRQEVIDGALDLGVDLWEEHIPTVLKAMQQIAQELGLKGNLCQ